MEGIDGVTHFHDPGLEVSGGELTEGLAGDTQVCRAFLEAASGENCACFDIPSFVTLNQNEAFVRRDRGNSAHQLRSFGLGLLIGLHFFGLREDSARGESHGGEHGQPEESTEFHEVNLDEMSENETPELLKAAHLESSDFDSSGAASKI